MKLNAKKGTVFAMFFIFLFSLTACGDASNAKADYLASFDEVSQNVFVSEIVPVEFDSDILSDFDYGIYAYTSCITSDGVYLTVETHKQVGTGGGVTIPEKSSSTPTSPSSEIYPIYAYGPSLFHASLSDGNCRLVDGYQSFDLGDGTEESINSRNTYPGKDHTLWIVTDVRYWDIGYVTFLQQFDAAGNELVQINLNVLTAITPDERICNAIIDPEGRLYVVTADKMIVFDSSQKHLFTVKNKSQMSPDDQLYLLADGSVAVRIQKDGGGMGSVLQTIDVEAQAWGDKYALPESCAQIYSGNGEYLFFCNAGDSLLGYSTKADGFERLLIWTGVNIDSSQILCFTAFSGDQLAAAISSNGEIQIASLKKVPSSELPEADVINYGTLGLRSRERADIIEFNQTHQNCQVVAHDYSEYNIGDDWSQGVSRLNADLMAGKIDILDTAGQSIQRLGKRGLLEDLQPYQCDDPEIGDDELMYRVIETAMQDGKLYQAFPSFSIVTAAGRVNIVGNRMNWTLEDLAAVLETMPENCTVFGVGETMESLFENLFAMEQDNFVSWDTGRCDFTCEEFKDLLKFCGAVMPNKEEEPESACVAEGSQLLLSVELCALDGTEYMLFPEISQFIGYPQQDNSVGSFFRLSNGMAITTSCKNKKAAWSFVRRLFLQGYTSGTFECNGIPVNREDFDHMAYWVSSPYYEENITTSNRNQNIMPRSITKDEYAQLVELIDSIDTIYTFDETIHSIVTEEAEAYFNGNKMVEDVANLIQSRVSNYLSERF